MKSRNLILFIFFFTLVIKAQTGSFFIKNYTPADYRAADQNWNTAQDAEGRIFVANLDGVLVNDGLIWKKITLKANAKVTSLAKNKQNIIFVGGDAEFGFISKQKNGKLFYQSLSENLPKDTEFSYIWAIKCIGEDVFFCSNERIFQYRDHKIINILTPETDKTYHTFFAVGKHLFVREKNTGVLCLNKKTNKLDFLPGSELFKDPSNRIDYILLINNNQYWVGSKKLGTYILDYDPINPINSKFTKQKSPIDDWVIEQELYCAEKISDNLFAFGSLKDGLILTDKHLNITKKINFKSGLQDDAIKNIFVDANGNLWLSLNFGLTFIEINTPITQWTKQNGIKGTAQSVIKYQNNIYIANDKGVQVLDTINNNFIPTSITSVTWDLIQFDNQLLIATDDGLMQLKNNKVNLLFEEGPYLIYKYPYDKTTFYLGLENGIVAGKYENGVFTEIVRHEGWSEVKWAACNEEYVAFGTTENGVYILNPKTNKVIKNLDANAGLPSMTENNVFNYNDHIYIGTDKGIYKIKDSKTWQCIQAKEFVSDNLNGPITSAKQINNEVWLQISRTDVSQIKRNELSAFKPVDQNLIEDQKLLKRIKGIDAKDFYFDKQNVYISTNDGLYCYNILNNPKEISYNTIASYVINKNDTIYEDIAPNSFLKSLEIPYAKNEIHVVPSATDYFDKNEVIFSWFLEGQEDTYNSWQKSNLISYNKIKEGDYILHLRSMNIFGQIGKPIQIPFTVNAPWYRSIIAYILYVIVGILFIWLIVALNIKRLRAANQLLEKTVDERTLEVQKEKKIVEKQSNLIKEKHKEITDSINYAERIQRSFLATKEMLDKNLNDYFVFFKPKDVVSGDFYWAERLPNDSFTLVTADSTGHGVPGAIMSLLNITSIESAIKDGNYEPAAILNQTRKSIIDRLKKDGSAEGGKDGMDAALICFDFKNNKLTYSSANNPIWIVRDHALIELKGDKMPVGKHDKELTPFTQYEFEMNKGDLVYTLTDGFPDQFGGAKGKKFMYKQLKETLVSISDKPLAEQKQTLDAILKDWMGDTEQVDDITIIGIRI